MADVIPGVAEGGVAGSGDGGDFKAPSTEELLAAIDQMSGLSDETKKELVDGILAQQQDGGGFGALPHQSVAANSLSTELVWVLSLVSLVFLVLVFFGYKLYKSLVDREKRKEEKKRQKLQKKKK